MSNPERANGDRALLRFVARQGRITNEDVPRIEALLEEPELSVHDVLERENLISQKDLALLLAETLRLRLVDLTTYPLDANVTRELKENIATRYGVVPISIDERTIEVVTANPLDLDGLKAVEFATGKRVQAVVATQVEVKDALAHTYRLQESLEQFLQLVPAGESLVVNELSDEGDDLRSIAADAELPPVIKLADKMLIEGIRSRASDIHVEPEGDSVLVRYRVDGILEEAFRFPKWIQNPLVARLKVMAKLDITERRVPQDGRIQVRFQDKSVDMRVSSLPAQHGEKITLRILDASQAVKALDRLGFGPNDLKVIRAAAAKPQGMVLITGPTGSGKTTTLYALLREIFSPKTNIVTIENPIEYQLKGINQVEVNEKQGLTFGSVLRSVLRQDPDVILLGEIRDKETAQIAFQAASTGHLVLSTVHTNDAAGAVTRLIDLGLEPYAIASALNLVVAQRLVRQLCPNCSKPAEIDEDTRRQLHLPDDATIKGPVGCAQCRHGGYRSRQGTYEMLPMTTAMAKLIEAGAGESMVRQQARNEGYHSLLEDAVAKLAAGQTSLEELQRVVQINDDGAATQCPGCKKEIAEDYSVCPHCSKVLRATCGGCAKPLNPEWVRCPYCGAAAVVEEPSAAAAPAERRSFKALVVDDTSTIRDVVRHTLEHSDLGLTVLTAENGPDALDIAGRERPDIVILDISMPGMDGFEVCRRLRSEMRTAFVPVLMLTAHDSEDDVAKGFGVGADDYMVKPFRREGLITRVKRILERTYGSQAVGAPPPPNFAPAAPSMPADPVARPFVAAQAPGIDVAAVLADLTADREVLRRTIESCEARIGELAARPLASPDGTSEGSGIDPAVFAELRSTMAEMQSAHERALRELGDETKRALTIAEEALKSAQASAAAVPPVPFATMMTTVERLQGEQARLASALASVQGGGIDEECERRLQVATNAIEEMRAGVETLRRDAQAVRSEARVMAEDAVQRAHAEAAGGMTRVMQSLGELRAEVDAQRTDLARDGARARNTEEQIGRVHDALAACEKIGRELASLQRTVTDQQAQRDEDAQRVAAAEESARRARAEMLAAADHTAEDMTALRRTLAERLDGGSQAGAQIGAQVGIRLDAAEEMVRQAQRELTAKAAQIEGELATIKHRMDAHHGDHALDAERMERAVAAAMEQGGRDLAELRRVVAMQQDTREAGLDMQAAEEAMRRLQAEAIAAAEAAARAGQTEMMAASEQTARDLVQLRDVVAEQQGAQRQELAWLRDRLGHVRRVVVKLVRRGRAAAVVRNGYDAAHEDIGRQMEQTVAAITAIREDQAELTRDVTVRLADLPSAAEHRTVMAFLDGCEAQLTEFATRLDVQGHSRAAGDEEARQQLVTELQTLKGTIERVDGEQRRLAADVEERLRALMRTAAGGFDVQLALLRGKVEVLARSLRERVPVDSESAGNDAILQHRHGLMDMLRDQLTALQSSTDWRPQRVLDLLIESTLAAAVTPFRRMLQLAEGDSSDNHLEHASGESLAAAEPTAGGVNPTTDESASPS